MIIKKLPQFIINQIAAGEIIERPSSIIKELLENSIDANSSEIEISIINSGKSYICVYDNGDGFEKDDFENAVTLHATSKLNNLDLNKVEYLGFRGEALASISSVAKIQITSKHKTSDHAWTGIYEKDTLKELIPSPLRSGTKIEINDLFFSVPARLNFLKSDQTELNNIINTCKQIIIPHNKIQFQLKNKDKIILKYKASDLKTRIIDAVGNEFKEDIKEVFFQRDDFKISGFIGKPTLNFKSNDKLFFYINGRYIKDKLLNYAVKNAFSDLIPKERYPLAVLFFEIPQEEFDINVHPRKLEVRFKDIRKIQSLINDALREVIDIISNRSSVYVSNNFIDSFKNKYNREKIHDFKTFNQEFYNNFPTTLNEDNPNFELDFIPEFENANEPPIQQNLLQENIKERENNINLGNAFFQLDNKYIISKYNNSVFIVDQHAVHERNVFEKLKDDLNKKSINSQQLLIPEKINISEFEMHLLKKNLFHLENLGINIKITSSTDFEIIGIPEILVESNKSNLFHELIENFIIDEENINEEAEINCIYKILATFACHTSIRSGKQLSINEMNEILRMIENNHNSAQCNHGRPSYVEFSIKDFDKLFNRG